MNLYELLKKHIGHEIAITSYGNEDCIAIEDLDTNEIIFDTDTYELAAAE